MKSFRILKGVIVLGSAAMIWLTLLGAVVVFPFAFIVGPDAILRALPLVLPYIAGLGLLAGTGIAVSLGVIGQADEEGLPHVRQLQAIVTVVAFAVLLLWEVFGYAQGHLHGLPWRAVGYLPLGWIFALATHRGIRRIIRKAALVDLAPPPVAS